MDNPKIIIKHAKFIDPFFRYYYEHEFENHTSPNSDDIKTQILKYKKEWKKNEKRILKYLPKKSGLSFQRNIIDVYIVGSNKRQFSDPIVIKSAFSPKEFVDVLTHELIHKLYADNSQVGKEDLKYWKEKYPKESWRTINHIQVHALLTGIYLDVLQDPTRLELNKKRSQNHSTKAYIRG